MKTQRESQIFLFSDRSSCGDGLQIPAGGYKGAPAQQQQACHVALPQVILGQAQCYLRPKYTARGRPGRDGGTRGKRHLAVKQVEGTSGEHSWHNATGSSALDEMVRQRRCEGKK